MSGKPTGTFCSNIWEDRPAELRCPGGRIPTFPLSPDFVEFYGEQTPSALLTHPTPHHRYLPQQNETMRERDFPGIWGVPISCHSSCVSHRVLQNYFNITDTISLLAQGCKSGRRLVFLNLVQKEILLPKIEQIDKEESSDVSVTGSWLITQRYTISMILQNDWLNWYFDCSTVLALTSFNSLQEAWT